MTIVRHRRLETRVIWKLDIIMIPIIICVVTSYLTHIIRKFGGRVEASRTDSHTGAQVDLGFADE